MGITVNNQTQSSSQPNWPIFVAFGGLILICCFGMACYLASLFIVSSRDVPVSILPTPTLDLNCESTDCLNACIRQLPNFDIPPLGEHRSELSKKEGGYELARYRLDEETLQLKQIAHSTIPEYLRPYQDNTELHRRIWDYFTGLFPNDAEVHVSYMAIYMDSSKGHYAARISDLDGKWRLYINLVAFDEPESVVNILTHEYGHMLTLNKNQITAVPNEYGFEVEQDEFDSMRAHCDGRFFLGYQCADNASYLNEFGNRFWIGEVYDTWIQAFLLADKDRDAYQSAIDALYAKYPDQFVTDYAATNPREDIAESWAEFILRPKPTGTSIAEQKVLFFYEFPELVQLRSEIIHRICQYAIAQK